MSRRNASNQAFAHPTPWSGMSDEELLGLRFCDLGVRIENSIIEIRIAKVLGELERRGLCFRPHFWLGTEWYTPDGIPGAAVPFYLAHPRLVKLEENQLLEAEGDTQSWCLALLRHEIGHAIDNAYRLRRKRKWQQVFGKGSLPYPDWYQPKPYSKRYVLHLDSWYAQAHPTEDFAETFAVWLSPHSNWKKRYRDWPALRKLEYVDQLMREIADVKPPVRKRAQHEPIHRLKATLRDHYDEKRRRYSQEYPNFYDRDLRRLFGDHAAAGQGRTAASFLRRVSPEIRRLVARWTGEYQYTINQVLEEMIIRCRELKLRATGDGDALMVEAAILLSVQTMNFLHSGQHRIVM